MRPTEPTAVTCPARVDRLGCPDDVDRQVNLEARDADLPRQLVSAGVRAGTEGDNRVDIFYLYVGACRQ